MAPYPRSIPARLARWLQHHPAALASTIATRNRLRRLAATPRRRLLVAVALALGVTVGWVILTSATTAHAIEQALGHPALVVVAAALYSAASIPKRRRAAATAAARSWLVATPRARSARGLPVLLMVLRSVVLRWLAATVVALLASSNAGVTLEQSLTLTALLAAGGVAGAAIGGWLALRSDKTRRESSRYTRRFKSVSSMRPSAAALSRWPIAQALAWARPENSRLLLLVAILTVPAGIGPIAAVGMLASWAIVSYLGALLVAAPLVARAATDWLRSTPISFSAFAWPFARRQLLHQLGGTFVGVGVMVMAGAEPLTATYVGAVWLALVALVTAISLADCYRARSPLAKITLSLVAVLFAEQREHGWGIALAVLLTALYLRGGRRHARA